jgi:hypothetical protein
MARHLKITLCDENDYIFSTLSLKEQKAIKKRVKQNEDNTLLEKLDNDEKLTTEEQNALEEMQDKRQDSILEIIRMSLAKRDKGFIIDENNTVEKINEHLEEIIDLNIMDKVASFAMTGTVPKNVEEEYDIKDIIDLTNKNKD